MVDFTKCEPAGLVPADGKTLLRGWSRFCLVYLSTMFCLPMRWNSVVRDFWNQNVLPQLDKDTNSVMLVPHKKERERGVQPG